MHPRSVERIDIELNPDSVPYVWDLKLAGVSVLPTAALLEIAHAVVSSEHRGAMLDVEFPEAAVHTDREGIDLSAALHEDGAGAYEVRIHRADWERTLHFRADFDTAHANGRAEAAEAVPPGGRVSLTELQRRCGTSLPHDEFTAALTEAGTTRGPSLDCVDTVWHGPDGREALAALVAKGFAEESGLYRLHPVMLEAALQPVVTLVPPPAEGAWQVAGIGRFRIHRDGAVATWAHAVRTDDGGNDDSGTPLFAVDLYGADGDLIADLSDVRLRTVDAAALLPPRFGPPSSTEIRALDGLERHEAIRGALRSWLAQIVRTDPGDIDTASELRSSGIDSFMGMELKSLLQRHWEVDLPLPVIFDDHSLDTLVHEVDQRLTEHHTPAVRRREREVGAASRLSRGQEALWSIHRFADESGAYHVATAVRVLSPLDVDGLRSAWESVITRHELLGAVFGEDAQGPYFRVDSDAAVDFAVVDARGVVDEEFEAVLADEADRPFVLDGGVPVRLRVFERSDGRPVLLMCAHHIVVDMWSCVVLLDELALAYGGQTGGDPAVEYADFVDWQRDLLSSEEGERLWGYWNDQLSGDLPVLALPADRPRPAVQTFHGANLVFGLTQDLTDGLTDLAARHGVTPFVVLLAAYQLFLHRETGQERVIVGSPVSGRGRSELDRSVGYFINPLPMVADLRPGMSFEELLKDVQETVLGAFEHEDFPMAEMVERLAPERDSSYSPLYQTMFVMQRSQAFDKEGLAPLAVGAGNRLQVGESDPIDLHSLVVEPVTVPRRWSMFDLTWMVAQGDDGFLVSVDYNTDLFDESTVNRFLEHFRALLGSLAASPEQEVGRIPLLSVEEYDTVVRGWNATAEDFGAAAAGCLHEKVWD
ncbi:condensation domain-containing protein, partial [Nocardiopsis rhodophaea]|uniref:condensation domain-containing protein n=1 Tax=Nocardiopsis rhodophaea TaxID=280238 RepID=UPI0031DDC7B6